MSKTIETHKEAYQLRYLYGANLCREHLDKKLGILLLALEKHPDVEVNWLEVNIVFEMKFRKDKFMVNFITLARNFKDVSSWDNTHIAFDLITEVFQAYKSMERLDSEIFNDEVREVLGDLKKEIVILLAFHDSMIAFKQNLER